MKRKVWAGALLLGAFALWGQSPRAFIGDLRGTVEYRAPGSGEWRPATVGQELEEETEISTGFRSMAFVRVGNSTLVVRPLTRLGLGEIRSAAADRVEVELRAGRLRVDVKPPGGGRELNFRVRSPMVTASVRGTVFDVDTLNLEVKEGTVAFSGADRTSVYVAAGESSSADSVSGRTAAPVGTASALAPPPPAGAEASAAPPAVTVSPAPVNVKIGWD
ncbi:MAG: FecR family protein [Treponema sp.]|jgi:hypothetical protein|nr:FecR family protein [Treponema sp.]